MRRILAYFPIIAVALLAQIYAPVGAGFAMARASSDPLFQTAICGQGQAPSDNGAPAPGNPTSHDDCCALCHFVHSGAAPLPQWTEVFVSAGVFHAVEWVTRAAPAACNAHRACPQARAPPQNS